MLGAAVGDLDIEALLGSPEAQAAGGLLLALLLGYAVITALTGVLVRAASRTHTDLDDHLVAILRPALLLTVLLLALEWAGDLLRIRTRNESIYDGVLGTLGVAAWVVALERAVGEVLTALHAQPGSWLRGRASGLLRLAVRLLVLAAGAYALVLVWGADLSAWNLSAGVVGVVLAFAAQDSLGNLVSGLFILADRPLRIGDWLQVDDDYAVVTDIGWRSTRLLTRDGIEINYPNGKLSEARIINESAGPHRSIRLWCEFSVEFGRSPGEVAAAVLPGLAELPDVDTTPRPPELYFQGQTEVGLRFALVVHIRDPGRRPLALDAINCHTLRALEAKGIRFAYLSHDVHLGGPFAAALQSALAARAEAARGPSPGDPA